MKRFLFAAALALTGLAGLGGTAEATPVDPIRNLAGPPILEVQNYVFAGRRYCFYPDGWRGPGFYWCGYAWRQGFGWGGPLGWRGWTPRMRGPRAYRPAPRFRGKPRHGHWR